MEYVTKDSQLLKICKVLSKDPKLTVRNYFKNRSPFEDIDTYDDYYEINPGLLFNNNLNFLIKEFSLNLPAYYSSDKFQIKSENYKDRTINNDFSHNKELLLNSESEDLKKNQNIILEDEKYKSDRLDSLDYHPIENTINQVLEEQDDSSLSLCSTIQENEPLLDESPHPDHPDHTDHSEGSSLI